VQIGTATFLRPDASLRVVAGMREFLAGRGLRSIAEWRGTLCGDRLGEAPARGAPQRGKRR